MAMHAYKCGFFSGDGLYVVDLEPNATELMAVGVPPTMTDAEIDAIDPELLPDGVRWIESDEWSDLVEKFNGRMAAKKVR